MKVKGVLTNRPPSTQLRPYVQIDISGHEDIELLTPNQAYELAERLNRAARNAEWKSTSPDKHKLCKKHPTYQAKRAPTADCEPCWQAWDKSWNNAARNGGQ